MSSIVIVDYGVGNLKSVLTILQQISGAGIYEGAVKYLSEEYKNRQTFILQAVCF